jgi:hypothetical protein
VTSVCVAVCRSLLKRFPIRWNRLRFHLIGNARTDIARLTGQIPSGRFRPAGICSSLSASLAEPAFCRPCAAAGTSRQGRDEGIDQSSAHRGDRVWDVTLRPQGRILGVGNLGEGQVARTARRDELPRGESSAARRSGSRRRRCTAWRDDGSHASRALHSGRARPPA